MRRIGFALVELLAVVAVIGVLAAIAIPSLTSQKAKAKDPRIEAALTDIDGVIQKTQPANIAYNAPLSIPFGSDEYIDLKLSVNKSFE
jgi:prepilin-type N-terminal cleavage/methylation domain-containing protein